MHSWGRAQLIHFGEVCEHGRPFTAQVDVGQAWSRARRGAAHILECEGSKQHRVWWPYCWQLAQCEAGLKRRWRSVLTPVENAKRWGCWATSCAQAPVRVGMTEQNLLFIGQSPSVSERGERARARPLLKVVSSCAMSSSGRLVGRACTIIRKKPSPPGSMAWVQAEWPASGSSVAIGNILLHP